MFFLMFLTAMVRWFSMIVWTPAVLMCMCFTLFVSEASSLNQKLTLNHDGQANFRQKAMITFNVQPCQHSTPKAKAL